MAFALRRIKLFNLLSRETLEKEQTIKTIILCIQIYKLVNMLVRVIFIFYKKHF